MPDLPRLDSLPRLQVGDRLLWILSQTQDFQVLLELQPQRSGSAHSSYTLWLAPHNSADGDWICLNSQNGQDWMSAAFAAIQNIKGIDSQ